MFNSFLEALDVRLGFPKGTPVNAVELNSYSHNNMILLGNIMCLGVLYRRIVLVDICAIKRISSNY